MDNGLLHKMITELQIEVRHDYKTGGPLAWRCVSGQPQEGDRVLVGGEIVSYKADDHAALGLRCHYISDRVARLERITALTDAYMDATDKEPDHIALERITDLVLFEELTDTNKNKMKTEYPIMSERMEKTRRSSETSEKMAEEYDHFGKNNNKPVRRRLSTYESIQIDKSAKSKNAEKRKNYNAFTKGYLVVVGETPEGEKITERRYTLGQFTINIATGEKVYH